MEARIKVGWWWDVHIGRRRRGGAGAVLRDGSGMCCGAAGTNVSGVHTSPPAPASTQPRVLLHFVTPALVEKGEYLPCYLRPR